MAIDESRTFKPINIAILTVSDTRTPETDTSGDILAARVTDAGHTLAARTIVKDDAERLAAQFDAWIDDAQIDAIVSTGGTGLTGRDVTPEAFTRIKGARDIPGFGELFRWLSYKTIGTSTVQSRAARWSHVAPISLPSPVRTERLKMAGTASSPSNSTAATVPVIS